MVGMAGAFCPEGLSWHRAKLALRGCRQRRSIMVIDHVTTGRAAPPAARYRYLRVRPPMAELLIRWAWSRCGGAAALYAGANQGGTEALHAVVGGGGQGP